MKKVSTKKHGVLSYVVGFCILAILLAPIAVIFEAVSKN
jgi:hypothetical protein